MPLRRVSPPDSLFRVTQHLPWSAPRRGVAILLACLALFGIQASPLAAQPLPDSVRTAFDSADGRARALAYWLQCVPTIARLRAAGQFGEAATAPKLIHCERLSDGVPIGGVFDVDSSLRTVTRLQLVHLDGDRREYTAPVDTVRVAAEVRLVRAVTQRLGDAWRRQNHPFSAIPIARAGGDSEVWVIPRANRARMVVTGGDMGFVAGADGSLQVIADRSATWTQLPLPADGPLEIISTAPLVPAVSDLLTARYQAELGRTVSVRTSVLMSRLVPGFDPVTGARFVWEHALPAGAIERR